MADIKIKEEKTMRVKKGLVLRHIGEEHVIVVPNRGTVDMTSVYRLTEVAAWLWKQFEDKEFTAPQMVELLLQHYDVEPDRAAGDVDKLIEDLKEHGLVVE